MKLYAEIKAEEVVNSFVLAGTFYDFCKGNSIDVTTVANMMLLEATNEANSVLYNSNCCVRSDTE